MDNLDKRVEALFQNEIKKSLRKTRDDLFSSTKPKPGNRDFRNKLEEQYAFFETFGKLPDALIEVGNKFIEAFEQEIIGVAEPLKSKAIEKLKELVITEIQALTKDSTNLF